MRNMKMFWVVVVLILCMCAATGCTSTNNESTDMLNRENSFLEADEAISTNASLKTVSFSDLYASLPERVILSYSEEQSVPWRLDADVIVPANLSNANSFLITQSMNPIEAEWESVVHYLANSNERENASVHDSSDRKFRFENDTYVKHTAINEGSFRYRYTEKEMRNLDDGVLRYMYVENGEIAGYGLTFNDASTMAERALIALEPKFTYKTWREGALIPIDAPMIEGEYLFLYSQEINGMLVANPCEQGGDFGDVYVPEYMGARVRITSMGVTEIGVQGYETVAVAEQIDEILSLDSAITLYQRFVRENRAEVDGYHTISSHPFNRKISYAEEAMIDQIRLCYIVTVNQDNEYLLIPCWMFSCGSSNNYGFGIAFHAVTGEVVWLNTSNK